MSTKFESLKIEIICHSKRTIENEQPIKSLINTNRLLDNLELILVFPIFSIANLHG